jgi:NADH dehydrogenase (ubiquinone) 1 alpha subcomplex subunit 8
MSDADTSSTALYAAAKVLAPECQAANTAFIVCKRDNADPAKCVQEGEKVTACVLAT